VITINDKFQITYEYGNCDNYNLYNVIVHYIEKNAFTIYKDICERGY
jgi:hypothetical protein